MARICAAALARRAALARKLGAPLIADNDVLMHVARAARRLPTS